MKNLIAFISALLFGLGLGISGMTQPQKVLGFLDITGAWDPSLMFVMIGAIAIHAIAYRFVAKKPKPLLGEKFHLPTRHNIDRKLLVGSALFGIGWGIGGYCPGPALVSVASGYQNPLVFVVSMILGIYLFKFSAKLQGARHGN